MIRKWSLAKDIFTKFSLAKGIFFFRITPHPLTPTHPRWGMGDCHPGAPVALPSDYALWTVDGSWTMTVHPRMVLVRLKSLLSHRITRSKSKMEVHNDIYATSLTGQWTTADKTHVGK